MEVPLLHSEYYNLIYLPLIRACNNTGEIMERQGELGQWIMALDIKPLYQDVFFKEVA